MKQKTLALLLAAPIAAFALDGIDFEQGDWQIVCDNSGTCRAAGYQSDEGDNPPVSVQFTRKAGEKESVQGAISLLDANSESAPAQVEMQIDGKSVANITLKDDGSASLDQAQTGALLAAVQKKNSKITFRENAKKTQWRLSTVGANAVLLKMDDFQERVNTASALIKRGNHENAVLSPAALPVIKAVTPPQDTPRELKKSDADFATMKKLLAAHYISEDEYLNLSEKDDHFDRCPHDAERGIDSENAVITLYPLDDKHYLSESPCWFSAYNVGLLYTLVSRDLKTIEKTYDNRLNSYDEKTGVLHGSQKTRGIGDCWSIITYQWDGKDFVKSYLEPSSLCKGFAGGAWEQPQYLTTIESEKGTIRSDELLKTDGSE